MRRLHPRLGSALSQCALCLCVLCIGCEAQLPGSPAAASPTTVVVRAPAASGQPTGGWHLTVYYTPVEAYHGPPVRSISDCAGRALGQHSIGFLDRIQTEGFGRVVSPIQGNRYLGWNFDRNCWYMASTPLGANERPLRAWASTAAASAYSVGTRVRVVACGSQVDADVCADVKEAAWIIDDRCTNDCTNAHHLDLYIGEENQPNFEDESRNYFDARDAVVALFH